MNNCCDVREKIVDVDCLHEPGRFILGTLPGCMPSLFTVRFRCPADYAAGEMIVVKGVEMPVMTSQMEAAGTSIFKLGAVVMCEIDMDRNLAFIRTGGAGSGEDVAFQTSDLMYYIDPLGDDSPNNPGGTDSPFKTLAGAGRAAWENIVMNPLGKLVFSFNPGTYELTEAERVFMTEATHPLGILFKGTYDNEKPVIKVDQLTQRKGHREFQRFKVEIIGSAGARAISILENATLRLRDSEVMINNSHRYVFGPNCDGTLILIGTIKVNGDGNGLNSIFNCHRGTLWANDARISLENIDSVTGATAEVNAGHLNFTRTTFSGSITGRRYQAINCGVIYTNNAGPNFIPGTITGSTATGGVYS